MKEDRLFRIIGDVDDDLVEEATAEPIRRPALRLILPRIAIAACLVLVVTLSLLRFPSTPQLLPQARQPEAAAARDGISPFSSPMGMRKFLNYSGYRYAFLEDGAPYNLAGLSLDDRLGVLEHDILAGMDGLGDNGAATLDFAATFALGGEIYRIPGYDPAYRLAVAWQGETYLAELVGRVDNQPLDMEYFFAVSGIESRIRRVEISPHAGGEVLSTVKRSGANAFVSLLASSQPAQMAEEDYLAMANAQLTGRSWQLALRLNDGTSLTVYLIPDLGLASVGDTVYTLPEDFQEKWGGYIDGLTQGDTPLY